MLERDAAERERAGERAKEVNDCNDRLLGQILCGGFEPLCGVCFLLVV